MPTLDNDPKYHETIAYHHVYAALIAVARHRGTITYQELAHRVGLPLSGNHMSREIGNLLGAVSVNELNHQRPMLSAIAVKKNGAIGDGFYNLARDLGLLTSSDPDDETNFLNDQRRQIYAIWQQQFWVASSKRP